MEGKVIKVTGTSSVFSEFIGRYAVIIDKAYGDKWRAEFNAKTKTTGGLIHTISEKDFEVVGIINK